MVDKRFIVRPKFRTAVVSFNDNCNLLLQPKMLQRFPKVAFRIRT